MARLTGNERRPGWCSTAGAAGLRGPCTDKRDGAGLWAHGKPSQATKDSFAGSGSSPHYSAVRHQLNLRLLKDDQDTRTIYAASALIHNKYSNHQLNFKEREIVNQTTPTHPRRCLTTQAKRMHRTTSLTRLPNTLPTRTLLTTLCTMRTREHSSRRPTRQPQSKGLR